MCVKWQNLPRYGDGQNDFHRVFKVADALSYHSSTHDGRAKSGVLW